MESMMERMTQTVAGLITGLNVSSESLLLGETVKHPTYFVVVERAIGLQLVKNPLARDEVGVSRRRHRLREPSGFSWRKTHLLETKLVFQGGGTSYQVSLPGE
jgi:hypothetical protein